MIFLRDDDVARFADYRGLGRFNGSSGRSTRSTGSHAELRRAPTSVVARVAAVALRAAFWARAVWRALDFACRCACAGPFA